MKKLFAVLFLISSFTQMQATILIVDNNQNAPTPYSTISAAVNAAASGDTILVKASPTQYGNVTINNKEIHIVGEGYKPHNAFGFGTRISAVSFGVSGSLSASGSSLEGVETESTNFINGSATTNLTNITIKRCFIPYLESTAYAEILAYNNVLGHVLLGTTSLNCAFHNNIFDWKVNTFTYSYAQIYMNCSATSTFSGNHVYKNNIFLTGSSARNMSNGFGNSVFSDNIIVGGSYVNNSFYCTYSHNISFYGTNVTFNTSGTNNGGNNQVGVNPLFVSESNYGFDYTDDFHLQATSPGKNAGSDGTDVGIYGGLYPWPDGNESSGNGYMYSQEPQYPQVNQLILNNASVPQNGNINIQVRGIIND